MDRVLGAGAMGVVVRAVHVDLEQEVAIKFLHPELAARADSAERFRREAYSAARIPSEHVPHVLDAGELEGSRIPFIVMEYLQGRDLARELAARGPLPLPEAARYVLQACGAVGEAHAHGIVHRDLKPANLFLAEGSGGSRTIKVLDFGISKTLGPGPTSLSITEPATLMGSPGYMSPEQLESSRNVDARTDIWSLGVILFELVTGSLPFDGESVPQLIRSVIAGKRARLDELSPGLAPLEPVVARCLQQERARRFQSVAELREALVPLAPKPDEHPFSVGRASAPGSERGAPSADDAAALRQPSEVVPDSGWGWTHAMRRSSLWRTVMLAAVLGALGAFVFGQGRKLLRARASSEPEAAFRESDATQAFELLPAPALPPSPGDVGTPPGASEAPPAPLVVSGESAANPAMANPAMANPAMANPAMASSSTPNPSPASPSPVAPSRANPTPPSPAPSAPSAPPRSTPPAPTARRAPNAGASASVPPSPPAPSPPPPVAEKAPTPAPAAAPHQPPAASSDANAARDTERRTPAARNPYEIEEFGGRE